MNVQSQLARFFQVCPPGTVEWCELSTCNHSLFMNGEILPGDLNPALLPKGEKQFPMVKNKGRVLVKSEDPDSSWQFALFYNGELEMDVTYLTKEQIADGVYMVAGRDNLLTLLKYRDGRTRLGIYKYSGGVALNWLTDIMVKRFSHKTCNICSRGSECCVSFWAVEEGTDFLIVGLMYFSRLSSGRRDAWKKFRLLKEIRSIEFGVTPFITADHFGAVVESPTRNGRNELDFAWFAKRDPSIVVEKGPWQICKIPGKISVTSCRNDTRGRNILYVVDLINYAHFEIDTEADKVEYHGPFFYSALSAAICKRYTRGFFFVFEREDGKLQVRNFHDDSNIRNFNVVAKSSRIAAVTANCNIYITSEGKCVVLHLSRF